MSLEETVSRSTLDKPLHQLTEEDISQLTREDCRRYLKEKGMRRPSWNKSQAIQQVISLKKLLETASDSEAGAQKKLYIPSPENPHRVPKATIVDSPICVPAEESVPYRQKNPEKPDLSGDLSGRLVVTGNDSIPSRLTLVFLGTVGFGFVYLLSRGLWSEIFPEEPRTSSSTNEPVGQMTIFYCGKVNVYDDVPAEKARALMQFAACPVQLPLEDPFDATTARRPLPGPLQAASVKVSPDSPVVILPNSQTVNMTDHCRLHREESGIFREDNPAEGLGSRKASVLRYLEKRKDRFKSKRKVATPSAGLDIYLNHRMGNQTQNELSNRNDACSPTHIRPPNTPTRCSSMENANLSAGFNVKDMLE